jgi:iron complex outermembrane receptor protein
LKSLPTSIFLGEPDFVPCDTHQYLAFGSRIISVFKEVLMVKAASGAPISVSLIPCLATGLTMLCTPAAFGQEPGARTLAPVEVVGTRIKRTDVVTPAPVRIIAQEDIRNSGAISTRELIFGTSLAGAGEIRDVDQSDGFAAGAGTVSLRGLGSDATLVLLNGRRIAPFPAADPNTGQTNLYDINSIPLSAVERIEILPAGASAIYGSDAIAGVVNIVLKKDFQGAEAGVRYGVNQDGHFGNRQVYGLLGFGNPENGFSGTLMLQNSKRDATSVGDTRGVRESELTRLFNRNSPAASTASYPANFFTEAVTGNGAFTQFFGRDARCPALLVLPNGQCGYNPHEVQNTVAEREINSVVGSANLKVNQDLSLFSEFGFSRAQHEFVSEVSSIFESGALWFNRDGQRNFFQFVLPPGHPDNPTSVPVALRYRFSDVGPVVRNTTVDSSRLLVGARGKHAGWDWESALLYSKVQSETRYRGFLDAAALTSAIASGAYRPYGNNSPQTLASISPGLRDSGSTSNTSWDLKGTRELMQLSGGPMALAAGAEVRKEELAVSPDPRVSRGEIVGAGGAEASGNRRVASVFAELSAPFIKSVESQLALRHDRYSDYGNSTTPQIGLKWKPIQSLALRGTYGKSFRAPSLSTIGDSNVPAFAGSINDPRRCGQAGATPDDCNGFVAALLRGNPNLKPEKADSQTLGLVFSPNADFDVSIDYYRIDRTNEVALLNPIQILQQEATLPGAVVRNPDPSTWLPGVPNSGPIQNLNVQFQNLGRTVTQGIDMEANVRNSLGNAGKLKTQFFGSYLLRYKSRVNPGDPYVEAQGATGPIGPLPRFKGIVASTWSYRDFAVTGRVNHVSGWRFGNSAVACFSPNPEFQQSYECKVSPWTTVDFLLRYTGIKNLELGFGVQNIQDKPAPLDPGNVALGYNPSFHNPYGRYFTAWLNYKFY